MEQIVKEALEKALMLSERITTEELYNSIKDKLGDLTLADFRVNMGELFREGKLGEYETSRGRFGGIRLAGSKASRPAANEQETGNSEASADDSAEPENEETSGLSIPLSDGWRIHNTDKRNWAIQKLNGNVWLSHYYYSSLPEALKNAAKKIVNNELRLSTSTVKLVELADLIIKSEKVILAKLEALSCQAQAAA